MLYQTRQLGLEVWICVFRDRKGNYRKIQGLGQATVLARAMWMSGKSAEEITGGYTI